MAELEGFSDFLLDDEKGCACVLVQAGNSPEDRFQGKGVGPRDGASSISSFGWGINLERAVGRPSGCVPRGVWQGAARRNSRSIPTSCNAARRRAGRALRAVAAFTAWVSRHFRMNLFVFGELRSPRNGQLLFLG